MHAYNVIRNAERIDTRGKGYRSHWGWVRALPILADSPLGYITVLFQGLGSYRPMNITHS